MFSAADVVIGSGLQWGMATGALPKRPEIVAYTDRLAARPALQRVYAKDAALTAARKAYTGRPRAMARASFPESGFPETGGPPTPTAAEARRRPPRTPHTPGGHLLRTA